MALTDELGSIVTLSPVTEVLTEEEASNANNEVLRHQRGLARRVGLNRWGTS